jgi:hypothetical protein
MTLQLHVDCQAHTVTKCNIVSRQAAMKFQRWPENVRSLESRWSLRSPRVTRHNFLPSRSGNAPIWTLDLLVK